MLKRRVATNKVRAEDVRRVVMDRDLDGVARLTDGGAGVFRHIRSMLYSEDDLRRERAAEAIAVAAKALLDREPTLVSRLITDLIWTLNDESGMSGRGTPEALGRIGLALPDRLPGLVPIFLGWLEKEEVALNDEILDAGLLVTLGRLGPDVVDLSGAGDARLRALLGAPEARLRGTAAWTAGKLGRADLRDALAALVEDQATFPLYREGALDHPTVGEIARAAVAALA